MELMLKYYVKVLKVCISRMTQLMSLILSLMLDIGLKLLLFFLSINTIPASLALKSRSQM